MCEDIRYPLERSQTAIHRGGVDSNSAHPLMALGPAGPPTTSELQDSAADLVLLNGTVATVDAAMSMQQEAVAIQGNRFVAVGSNAAVRRWVGPETEVIDLGGRTVLPGLVDSHIHALRGRRTG